MKGTIDWSGWAKKLYAVFSKYKYVFLVILAGALLLLLPSFGREEGKSARPELAAEVPADFSLTAMEERLSTALSQIDGAGKARVVLTLKGGTRQIVAKDETFSEKENSSTTVVIARGSGNEEAVVLQQVYPQYQGALIICPGGEKPAVKLKITEAVAAVTGLGAARISVCKGNP